MKQKRLRGGIARPSIERQMLVVPSSGPLLYGSGLRSHCMWATCAQCPAINHHHKLQQTSAVLDLVTWVAHKLAFPIRTALNHHKGNNNLSGMCALSPAIVIDAAMRACRHEDLVHQAPLAPELQLCWAPGCTVFPCLSIPDNEDALTGRSWSDQCHSRELPWKRRPGGGDGWGLVAHCGDSGNKFPDRVGRQVPLELGHKDTSQGPCKRRCGGILSHSGSGTSG